MSSLPASLASIVSPTQTTVVARALRQARRGILAVVKAVTHRREITRMLELDDRMLKDIGLVRSDVLGALSGPISHDPSVLLRLRSVDNRSRQRAFEREMRRLKPVRSLG